MHWSNTTPKQQARVAELAAKCGLTLAPVARCRNIPYRYRNEQGDIAWRPGTKTVYYAEKDAGNILYTALHEICHWLVATPYERRLINWGYNLGYEDFPVAEREWDAAVVNVGLAKAMGFAKEACHMLHFYSIRDRNLLACTRKAKAALRAHNIRLKGVRP